MFSPTTIPEIEQFNSGSVSNSNISKFGISTTGKVLVGLTGEFISVKQTESWLIYIIYSQEV